MGNDTKVSSRLQFELPFNEKEKQLTQKEIWGKKSTPQRPSEMTSTPAIP